MCSRLALVRMYLGLGREEGRGHRCRCEIYGGDVLGRCAGVSWVGKGRWQGGWTYAQFVCRCVWSWMGRPEVAGGKVLAAACWQGWRAYMSMLQRMSRSEGSGCSSLL